MIFYYSATGNSEYVANILSHQLEGEQLCSIKDEMLVRTDNTFFLHRERFIVFVFPVHSWGPALPVIAFLHYWKPEGYNGQPVYAVCTCGDDCGHAGIIFGKELKRSGLPLAGYVSVQMPNTYILLPGFDVDSLKVQQGKVYMAGKRAKEIADVILGRRTSSELYVAGRFAWLKTFIVYPLFRIWVMRTPKFCSTDACVGCKLCLHACPTGTIRMEGNRPVWKGRDCVQCLACIHWCPVRAIEYGKETEHKGRYFFSLNKIFNTTVNR